MSIGRLSAAFCFNFYGVALQNARRATGIFHSGNSVNPLDYGIGLNTGIGAVGVNPTSISDFDTVFTGFSRSGNSGTLNTPDGGGFWTLTTSKYSGQTGTQLAMGISGNDLWFRGNPTSTWSSWREIYHSGNSNFNEFGGGNNGDVIATGFASSENVVRFYFPLSSKSDATSMSVTGTFTIKINGNIILTTSAEVLDLKLKPYGSKKLAVVEYETSGLTRGQFAELIIKGITSKIIFNF